MQRYFHKAKQKNMRINILLTVLIISSLSISCSTSPSDENRIEEAKFIDVLVDIHIADATMVVSGFRIKTDSTKIRLYYNDVLLKHNVTQKQIQNTFKYYASNPKKFEAIYEQVSEKIIKLEEENKKKIKEAETKTKNHSRK